MLRKDGAATISRARSIAATMESRSACSAKMFKLTATLSVGLLLRNRTEPSLIGAIIDIASVKAGRSWVAKPLSKKYPGAPMICMSGSSWLPVRKKALSSATFEVSGPRRRA